MLKNVIVKMRRSRNKKKELNKKKFLISIIENGGIKKKLKLQIILNQ